MNASINYSARLLVCTIIGVCWTAGLGGCGFGTSHPVAAKGSQSGARPPALVRVVPVEQRQVSPKVTVVGNIVPKRTSIVASGADGIVNHFHVEEGQLVQQSDVLSELKMETTDLEIKEARELLRERAQMLAELENGSRPEETSEARANMLATKAIMESTAATLNRTRALFARNASNQDELEAAQERAEAARQTYLASQAKFELVEKGPRIEQIEQARARHAAQGEHVAFLEAEKAKRITKAPFTGYIVHEHTYLGQWLSKGDPIVSLILVDEVDAVVNVDQADLQHVRLGATAQVRVAANGEIPLPGRIVSVVPRSEWQSGSRGFPIKVRLQNQFQEVNGQRLPVLKEGMMAEVTFYGEPVNAFLVPTDALVRTSRGLIVNVFVPDSQKPDGGSIRQLLVEAGLSDVRGGVSHVEIKAEGLVPGMQVVTEGAERLVPFQPVQIQQDSTGSD